MLLINTECTKLFVLELLKPRPNKKEGVCLQFYVSFSWKHWAQNPSLRFCLGSHCWGLLQLHLSLFGSLVFLPSLPASKEIFAFKLNSTWMGRLVPNLPAAGFTFLKSLTGSVPSSNCFSDLLRLRMVNTLNSIITVVSAVPPLLPLPKTVARDLKLQYHPAQHQGFPTFYTPLWHFQSKKY